MRPSEVDVEHHRRDIEGLAYRMLGDWAESQDVAQETFLKWHALTELERNGIAVPRSWLFKVASRLTLDRMKSARSRRETYVGPWLPDPWLVHERSPAEQVEADDSVTLALMLALERLNAAERAAFILKDVFDVPFEEIAEVLGKSSASCRKLATRARVAVRAGRPRYELSHEKHTELLRVFAEASQQGDLDALKSILADDVVLYSDSGGIVPAARKVLRSQDVVMRLFVGIARKGKARGLAFEREIEVVNGLPAMRLIDQGRTETLISISVVKERIQSVYVQRNPEKLRPLDR